VVMRSIWVHGMVVAGLLFDLSFADQSRELYGGFKI
jgi:hypothetical protein